MSLWGSSTYDMTLPDCATRKATRSGSLSLCQCASRPLCITHVTCSQLVHALESADCAGRRNYSPPQNIASFFVHYRQDDTDSCTRAYLAVYHVPSAGDDILGIVIKESFGILRHNGDEVELSFFIRASSHLKVTTSTRP